MIYFASDIHLGAGEPSETRKVEQRFVAWLDRVSEDAEAIFLLGDVFDFWFEYRRVVPKGAVRTLGKLAELTDRGIRVVFFAGNHDMWVRDYLQQECGVEVYLHPATLTLAGRRIYLAHGDDLGISGHLSLQLMNKLFRSRVLQWLFSWLVHPDCAVRFGRWWSSKSRKSHKQSSRNATHHTIVNPLIDYARQQQQLSVVDYYIFGHMHFACDYREENLRVLFLGAWYGKNVTYVALDDQGNISLETA
jgi:UDP-2,3-diacylglucosamine hydrolase